MLNPGQVSNLLEIPPSTLRRYVKLFGERHLSPAARKRRGRRFTDADVTTLAQIRALIGEGIPLHEVSVHLETTGEPERPAEAADLTVPAIVERLDEVLVELEKLRQELDDSRRAQQAQAEELARLRAWLGMR